MSTYFIGDLQGCYQGLLDLLDAIDFNQSKDQLIFCGDLVNRGPQSLETLRFVINLQQRGLAHTVLGNHDIHLMALGYGYARSKKKDTLDEILNAKDAKKLLNWLCQQPLCITSKDLGGIKTREGNPFFLTHAGLYPKWSISKAVDLAQEVHAALREINPRKQLLENLYGDQPKKWSNALSGIDRLRFIINALTRMRFLSPDGTLTMAPKGPPSSVVNPETELPWYSLIKQEKIGNNIIIFGHWSSIIGQCPHPQIEALDTGYIWGGALTALSLKTRQRIEVSP